jgi:hypothetical protein
MTATIETGPFARSKVPPTALEAVIAELIWNHAGRECPVSISEIIRDVGLGWAFELNARKVKEVVEQLRVMHRVPIGARRTAPFGYFRIVDAADREAAVGPYREQILTMWRTLRVLDSPERCRELLGQLALE